MPMFIVRLLLILMVGAALGAKIRYDNHRFYEIHFTRETVLRFKTEIVQYKILDRRDDGERTNITILVDPNEVENLEAVLTLNGISHKILDINIQQLIDEELQSIKPNNVSAKGSDFGWKNIYKLETIHAWIDQLAYKYSDIITILNIGRSHEGRTIKGVKLALQKDNPAVFVEAGIHADEWIGPAIATFILNQLLTSKDPQIRFLAENFNWIVFPVCNPDGYKYTFDKNRLWRKNRQRFNHCFGIDLNRNWNISWIPETFNPCSNNFPGPYAFSAPETRAIATYLNGNAKSQRIRAYLSFHSPTQKLMFPYASNHSRAPNFSALLRIGKKAAKAFGNRNGKQFEVGTFIDMLYGDGEKGTSLDWVYKVLKVPIVYMYNLRQSTYFLRADEIEAAGWETLDSVEALLSEAMTLGYFGNFPYGSFTKKNHHWINLAAIYYITFGGVVLTLVVICIIYKSPRRTRRRSVGVENSISLQYLQMRPTF